MNASLQNRPDLETYLLPADDFSDKTAVKEDAPLDTSARLRIAELVRDCNADMIHALAQREEAVDKSRNDLIPEQDAKDLSLRARLILNRYAVVDALALHYRNKTNTTFIRLLVATFFAMLIFELFVHCLVEFFPAGTLPRLLFWLYPILWAGAWLIWFHAHKRKYQRKYHDYRALAEGLRVQFFWNLLGLADRVEEYYLMKQKGELEWIRRALRWWHIRDGEAAKDCPLTADQLQVQKRLVRQHWVKGQFDYFANVAGPREERKGKNCKRWGAIFFWTSLALALGLGAWEMVNVIRPPAHLEHATEHHSGLHAGEQPLVVAISMLLVAAAVMLAYGEKMAFSEHTRQYGGTSILFRMADAELTDGALTEDEKKVFRALGREALQENGDWLLLHRDRPLEVIVP
jgi:hypothetical protein